MSPKFALNACTRSYSMIGQPVREAVRRKRAEVIGYIEEMEPVLSGAGRSMIALEILHINRLRHRNEPNLYHTSAFAGLSCREVAA